MNLDNGNWWEQPKEDVHEYLFGQLENIKIKLGGYSEANLRHLRLYGNAEVLGLRIGEFTKHRSLQRLAINVIQMCTDTVVARLSKSKPKPMFVTEDGDWTLKKQAKMLEQYCLGQFAALDMYEKGPMVLRDACVFGDGWMHFYVDHEGKPQAEKVFPEEIVVDEDEALYGEAKQIIRTKFVHKDVLMGLYPNKKAEIEKASNTTESYIFDEHEENMITVAEVYRIGSKKDRSDGRHVISISTTTLFDEKWAEDWIPFVRMRWNPRLLGYYSQGLAEILTGIQVEINKLLMTIQKSMHLGSVPKIFVENMSKIVTSHLNNDIGTIVKYTGTPPRSEPLMNIPPELFNQLERLYQRSFEQAGVSRLSSASEKPAGLNSGKALRDFHDIESERFAVHAQRYENFYMNCARMLIKTSQHAAKKNPSLSTTFIDTNRTKKIKWSEIKLKDEEYVMRLYAANLLSDTPSGRLADVDELMRLGLIDKRQAKSLLDYPDVEGMLSIDNAIVDNTERTIEKFIEDGIYEPPDELQGLDYAFPVMQQAYLKYKNWGLDEEKLELFRLWLNDAMLLISPPEPEIDPAQLEEEELQQQIQDEEAGLESDEFEQEGLIPS